MEDIDYEEYRKRRIEEKQEAIRLLDESRRKQVICYRIMLVCAAGQFITLVAMIIYYASH